MLINIYDSVEACLCIHLLPRVTVGNVHFILKKKKKKAKKKGCFVFVFIK